MSGITNKNLIYPYKKPFSLPDMTPWAAILLILWLGFAVTSHWQSGPRIDYLPIRNLSSSQYQPSQNSFATISIDREGRVWVGDNRLEEANDLKSAIAQEINKKEKNNRWKVLLASEIDIKYGEIVDIFKILQSLGIRNVALITGEYLTLLHLFYPSAFTYEL